ncbi:MAG: hypothetical protein AAFR33_14095, partial [Pseudomonadota bacterium]
GPSSPSFDPPDQMIASRLAAKSIAKRSEAENKQKSPERDPCECSDTGSNKKRRQPMRFAAFLHPISKGRPT